MTRPSAKEVIIVRFLELEILPVLFIKPAQLIELDELAAQLVDFRLFGVKLIVERARGREPAEEIFDALRDRGKGGLDRGDDSAGNGGRDGREAAGGTLRRS